MPTFPSTAAFPASASFPSMATFPFGGLTLTNDQRLSLPTNTPVGTEVMVSDWVAAGLDGPHQRLNAPSTAQGGVFVSGGTQDGIYSDRGILDGDKHIFNLLGEVDATSHVKRVFWIGSQWNVFDDSNTLLYYSLSDVATPDLASNWKNAADDSPASITVTSVTQGELDAGMTVAGAGSTEVNATYTVRGNGNGRKFYNPVGQPTDGPDDSGVNCIYWGGTFWYINSSGGSNLYYPEDETSVSSPWLVADWENNLDIGIVGDPPFPTVTRNDVCAESNWGVIP